MLETIDGGAKSRSTLQADTSWEPDFEENDFASSNDNVVPNIVTPSDSAVECSFDGWALSDNEMEAISQYSKKPSSDSPPPPPREVDVTARTSNVKTLNTTPDSSSGGKRKGKLSLAKKKYEKYVNKSSPKPTKKKETERELTEEEKEIARGVAAKQRERRESKKNKFKKMIKNKNKKKNPTEEEEVSPDPAGFDPWSTAEEETPLALAEEGGNVWESSNEECAKDEEKVEVQAEEGQEIDNIMASTPVKKSSSSDIKNQDIFRPKGGPSALPSPASKEINDVLKDVQNNLEVSAITKSSSALYDDSVDFEYDFNLESSQLDASEPDFQANIDKVDEECADEDGIVATDDEEQVAGKEQEIDVPAPPGKLSLFTCGMIDVEVTSPKQVMVDFTRDLKTGVRNSVRNFFGVCDVGEGADVVAQNVEETKKTWKQNVNKTRDHTKEYVAFGYKKE